MPIAFITSVYLDGWPANLPEPWTVAKVAAGVGALMLAKGYFSGARNLSERDLHGRVVMVTGGTSGIGGSAALELARRGAQIILLTRQEPATDPFIVEYVEDMRERSGNHLIYAEQVDLASLHSIRQFATRWIDNVPPRRLDMLLLCAATLTPPGGRPRDVPDGGVEETWMVNFLANFHLLAILSPALRAQPFDRDVRIIMLTCSSYMTSPPLEKVLEHVDLAARQANNKKLGQNLQHDDGWTPSQAYAASKLALMTFGLAFQKHLDSHKRPDQLPMTARVVLVDPGLARTPGSRRWLTRGSLWGLLAYVVFYWVFWIVLKRPIMASQSILYAAMEGSILRKPGGKLIKDCTEVDFARKDVTSEDVSKQLWESTDKLIEKLEKAQALRRARLKKMEEETAKASEELQEMEELEALVGAIREGKTKEAKQAKQRKRPKQAGKAISLGPDSRVCSARP